jgi:hypothetical protein
LVLKGGFADVKKMMEEAFGIMAAYSFKAKD